MLVKLILLSPVFLMSSISDFISGVRMSNDDRFTAEVRLDMPLVREPVY